MTPPRAKLLKKLLPPTRVALVDSVDRRVRHWLHDNDPRTQCGPRAFVTKLALALITGKDNAHLQAGAAAAEADDGTWVGWDPEEGLRDLGRLEYHVWLAFERPGLPPIIIDPSARYFPEIALRIGSGWTRPVPRVNWATQEDLLHDRFDYREHPGLSPMVNRDVLRFRDRAESIARNVVADLRRHPGL